MRPVTAQYIAATVQAIPMPRKTLTAFEPVTLPIDASAYWSPMAATLLANVSAKKIVRITIAIELIESKGWFPLSVDCRRGVNNSCFSI